ALPPSLRRRGRTGGPRCVAPPPRSTLFVRILLVTATDAEVGPILSMLGRASSPAPRMRRFAASRREIDVLTTGVGMVASAAWCSRALATGGYDLALNAGLCGSFDRALPA